MTRSWIPPSHLTPCPKCNAFWLVTTAASDLQSVLAPAAPPTASCHQHPHQHSTRQNKHTLLTRSLLRGSAMPWGPHEDAHIIVSCHDEFSKLLGSCHITALSNVNKVGVWSNPEGLETLKGKAFWNVLEKCTWMTWNKVFSARMSSPSEQIGQEMTGKQDHNLFFFEHWKATCCNLAYNQISQEETHQSSVL